MAQRGPWRGRSRWSQVVHSAIRSRVEFEPPRSSSTITVAGVGPASVPSRTAAIRRPRLSPSAKSSTPRRSAQRSAPTGGGVDDTQRVAGWALMIAARAGHSSALATSAVLNISPPLRRRPRAYPGRRLGRRRLTGLPGVGEHRAAGGEGRWSVAEIERTRRREGPGRAERGRREDPDAAAAPPGGARNVDPATVLWRQRAGGNAATIRTLSLGAPRLLRLVTLTPEDEAAVVEQLHDAMAGWGTDEEAIYVVLQKLGKDATAITKLKEAYKAKYGDDLEAEIRSEMRGSELRLALELLGVVEDPAEGPKVGGAAPGSPAEFSSAAKRLYAAMKGWGTDEEEVYAVLIPFKRDPAALATLATAYQTELSGGLTGKGLEEDIKDEMSGEERSYALYLLNAPPPRAVKGTAAVPAPGTEVHKGAVPGGEVTVRTGVQLGPGRPKEGYSIGYKGGLSADSAWLQFIWREVEVEHPTKGGYRVDQAITTSGGSYRLTT